MENAYERPYLKRYISPIKLPALMEGATLINLTKHGLVIRTRASFRYPDGFQVSIPRNPSFIRVANHQVIFINGEVHIEANGHYIVSRRSLEACIRTYPEANWYAPCLLRINRTDEGEIESIQDLDLYHLPLQEN